MFDAWIDALQKHKDTYLWLLDEGEDMKRNMLSYIDKRIDKNNICRELRERDMSEFATLILHWILEYIMAIPLLLKY